MAKNITLLGENYTDVPGINLPQIGGGQAYFVDSSDANATAADISLGKSAYVNGIKVIGTNAGTGIEVIENPDIHGGTIVTINATPIVPIRAGASVRPDAELVQTWTYDKYAVKDEKATIPAYATTATVLIPAADIATYTVDHTQYSYMVTHRILSIPIYSSTYIGGAGKEEYVFSAVNYEMVYEPGGTYASLDGTISYGTANPAFAGHGQFCRFVYWNKATSVAIYTSAAYGVGHTYSAPTIVANGTLTIKSPPFQIRGHATYMKEAVYDEIEDIRNQYIIELWRIKKNNTLPNGWDVYSSVDKILNDIKNNNAKLT